MFNLQRYKLNNKGISYLDTITSILILLAIITITVQFQTYNTTIMVENEKTTQLYQTINNKITEIYTMEDWTTLSPTETEDELLIEYNYLGKVPSFNTNQLLVKFSNDTFEKEYKLERSSYKWETIKKVLP